MVGKTRIWRRKTRHVKKTKRENIRKRKTRVDGDAEQCSFPASVIFFFFFFAFFFFLLLLWFKYWFCECSRGKRERLMYGSVTETLRSIYVPCLFAEFQLHTESYSPSHPFPSPHFSPIPFLPSFFVPFPSSLICEYPQSVWGNIDLISFHNWIFTWVPVHVGQEAGRGIVKQFGGPVKERWFGGPNLPSTHQQLSTHCHWTGVFCLCFFVCLLFCFCFWFLTRTHARLHRDSHIYIQTRTHARAQTHRRAHIHSDTQHARAYAHTRTHTHTHMHARTHAHQKQNKNRTVEHIHTRTRGHTCMHSHRRTLSLFVSYTHKRKVGWGGDGGI